VTSDGKPLIPQIQVPEDATGLSVGVDGTVSATVPGQADAVQLGRIELARFANPSGMQAIGDNMLVETAASGAPQVGAAGEEGRGSLRGGMLEGSNVNVVEELVDMIETQRAYEVNSKMISATDEMMKNASQTL
jgi:flagellar basal-body rod protein FlgG